MEHGRVSQSSHTSSLRIGLLVDSAKVSKYAYEFVKWAQAQHGTLAITHIIVVPPLNPSDGSRTKSSDIALFQSIMKIERHMLGEYVRHRDHLDSYDLSKLVPEQIIVTQITSEMGPILHFALDDISKLKKLNLDLLITYASRNLRGDILKVARLGIIGVDYANNKSIPGGPAGFWEVYFREDTTTFTIERLGEESDDGEVMMRGCFQTGSYYLLNQAVLFDRSNYYLRSVVERIVARDRLPDVIRSVSHPNKRVRLPAAVEAINYLVRLFAYRTRNEFRRRAGIDYSWQVGYTIGGWRNADLSRSAKINNPPSHFLADPFIISKDNRKICFVEDYDFQRYKGTIVAYELTAKGAVRLGTALEEEFHLSFPYIFEYQQGLYMCPETSGSCDIRIYKCAEFPLRWKLETIALQNISAADTMLFERDGRWWMFTNTDSVGDGDHCTELSIFFSDSPFGKRWTPHALNPIYVDAGRARNAGLIKEGNVFFRISQGQGFDTYGKRTLINEIVELTNSKYSEKTISVITAAFAKGGVGTHHLHSNGDVTVFDFSTFSRTKN